MPEPLQIDIKSSTLELLLKYVRDGIEATIGTWMLPWQARQEVNALLLYAEGQKDALNMIIARSLDFDLDVQLNSEFRGHTISSQGKKRVDNIRGFVRKTAKELEGVEVEDHDPNPDLSARIFGDVQDVSSEQLQSLWAKILANEIRKPGQISLRTLSVLKDLSQQEAEIFEEVSSLVLNGEFLFSGKGILKYDPSPSSTVNYDKVIRMQECGLIGGVLPSNVTVKVEQMPMPLSYHSKSLQIERQEGAQGPLEIPLILLTTTGQELYRVTTPEIQMSYLRNFASFLSARNHQLCWMEGQQKYTFSIAKP